MFSSVYGTPVKVSNLLNISVKTKRARRGVKYKPVLQSRGQMEFMRMLLAPYSAASPLVAFVTAALEALYPVL